MERLSRKRRKEEEVKLLSRASQGKADMGGDKGIKGEPVLRGPSTGTDVSQTASASELRAPPILEDVCMPPPPPTPPPHLQLLSLPACLRQANQLYPPPLEKPFNK